MKKFLFATLLAVGVVTLVPEAHAGDYRRHGNNDRYHGGHYDRHYHSHYSRPRVVYRHRPVRVYDDCGYYAPRVRYYESRPRVSLFFGF